MIVSVDEAKIHMRIEHNEEDEYVARLIEQAGTAATDFCRVSFDPYVNQEGNEEPPPAPVRLAVLLMATYNYENRDVPDVGTYKGMRMAFENLLYPYRNPDKMF